MSSEKLATEARREQIARAALGLVARDGLDGVSVGRVARSLGLVPSAIYRHYASKEEMVDAVLELIRGRIAANVEAAVREGRDPLEQMRSLFFRQIAMVREINGMPRIMTVEGMFSKSPSRQAKAREMLRGILRRLEAMAREGQKRGLIRGDLEASTVAILCWGLLLPSALLWHISGGDFDITRHAERAWRVFRESIAAPGAGSRKV